MPTDTVLFATFDKVATPDGGDRLVKCDTDGKLEVVSVPAPGSDEIQGKIADGAPALATKPVIVSGKDAALANQSLQMRSAAPGAADPGVVVRNIPSGTQTVSPVGASTAALANVAQNAAASVVLIAANATRRTAWVYNDPSNAGILYVKWGVGASSTSFTQALLRGESMFWDGEEYSGVVEGRWSLAGAGAARVTESTP